MFSYETNDFKYVQNNLFLNNTTSFSATNKNTIFFPITPIVEENNKNISLQGIHKSASITFYSKKLGYLLCKEIRDNKLVYHPIGGKYEEIDKSIEYTACREFIEETGILQNIEFINLLKNKKESAINILYNILKNDESSYYFDYYVNKEKAYLHRYYIIDINKIDKEIMNIIKNMDIFYENTSEAGEEYITGLHWNKEIIQNSIHRKNYSMLTIYLSNLIKAYYNNKS